jgi:hypothetical protein
MTASLYNSWASRKPRKLWTPEQGWPVVLAEGEPAEIDSQAGSFSVRVLVLVSNFLDSALAEFAARSVEGSRPVLCPASRRGHKGQHAGGTHLRVVSIGTSLLSEVGPGSRLNATRPLI